MRAFSSKKWSCRCSVGSTILHVCWVWTVPEVSEEKGSYALLFYRLFYKVYKLSFTSCGFARFNWHSLLAWRFFLWLSLTRRPRYLIQKYFHSIPLMTWTPTLHFCSVKIGLYGERKYTHTHTHTHTRSDRAKIIVIIFTVNCSKITLNM